MFCYVQLGSVCTSGGRQKADDCDGGGGESMHCNCAVRAHLKWIWLRLLVPLRRELSASVRAHTLVNAASGAGEILCRRKREEAVFFVLCF